MADPAVVVAMRSFKQALLAREEAQMRLMAQRWLAVEQTLAGQIDALAEEIARARAAGHVVSIGKLYRLERYKALLAQAQSEFEKYAAWAGREIERMQSEIGRMALDQAVQAIQLSYWPRIAVDFKRLPVDVVEAMAGLTADGMPVSKLLKRRMVRDEHGRPLPGVHERLTQTLIDAAAQGWNPRKTARQMRDDLAAGLQKALVIARTEQLRVAREATRAQYVESGVVKAQKRLAAHDWRTCAACLADDGKLYPIDAVVPDHVQGRCTSVPVLLDGQEPKWQSGEEWLKEQPENVQRDILGSGHYEAWKAGKFELSDVVRHTHDPEWGDGIQVRPLRELV